MPLGNNYGGVLQNYALQRVLERMGHSPLTIDCRRKPWLRRALSFFKTALLWLTPRRRPFSYCRRRPFIEDFMRRNIHATPTVRHYAPSIVRKYALDAIVVGSDQIWNPRMGRLTDGIRSRYLCFAEGFSLKRVAYAVSFGKDEWEYTPRQTAAARRLVRLFDGVSVREKSGVALCRERLGVAAEWVLDPTLLLRREDYAGLCGGVPPQGGFLLAYILNPGTASDARVAAAAAELELPARHVYADAAASLTVEEWLAMFRDASFVITDSFHGTVFSIIFNKPFTVLRNEKRGMARLTSLLALLGLERRLASGAGKSPGTRADGIDWRLAERTLEAERARSLAFLEKHLG